MGGGVLGMLGIMGIMAVGLEGLEVVGLGAGRMGMDLLAVEVVVESVAGSSRAMGRRRGSTRWTGVVGGRWHSLVAVGRGT